MTLDDLRGTMKRCPRCVSIETPMMFGEGSPNATLMIIGEAPGQWEVEYGRPYTGRPGKLLDKMLAQAGVHRNETFITYALQCPLPGFRDPKRDEVHACTANLFQKITVLQPRVLLALGLFAHRALLGGHETLKEVRQKDLFFQGIPLVTTHAPLELFRDPELKRYGWEDMNKLKKLLKGIAQGR